MEYIKIEDFLPKYPYTNDMLIDPEFNSYDGENFQQAIFNKKEFNSLRVGKDDVRESGNILFNHQKVISRFLSSHAIYDSLLLVHEMGTGKTCAAFGTIENIKNTDDTYTGAIVLTQSPNVLRNLIFNLAQVCTGGKYMPNKEEMSDIMMKAAKSTSGREVADFTLSKIKSKASNFYHFNTFGIFAKLLSQKTDEEIVEMFSNKIIVLDEVHNLKLYVDNDKSFIYKQIHRFLHLVKHCKKMLMSGTPMTDGPNEISTIMNLILPLDEQFPTGSAFTKKYLDKNDMLKSDAVETFKNKVSGYVSYLKASLPDIEIKFIGNVIPPLKQLIVYESKMSDFQFASYHEASVLDSQKQNFYSNSEQATLFVFPDSTYGPPGFKKYISEKTAGTYKKFAPKKEFTDEFS